MFTKEKFDQLVQIQDTTCVSLFIPTYRAGKSQEDRIRLKNALTEAKDQLIKSGWTESDSLKFLKKGYNLLEKEDFFLHLSDGLAMYFSENHFDYFTVPINFNEMVHLSQSYYLRPIISLLNEQMPFYLLALSQGEVKLFEIEQYAITNVKIKDVVPENIDAALALEVAEESIQAHSGNARSNPIYHGQGGGKDRKNFEIAYYFRKIDEGIREVLPDGDPLMLAGVDYLIPIFKDVAKYPNIMEGHVSGNPENVAPATLHEKALAAAPEYFDKEKKASINNFQAFAAEDRATAYIYDIVPAAVSGKVETLLTCKDEFAWGTYDSKTHKVHLHPEKQEDSICLLNFAAVNAFQQGGRVYNVPRTELPVPTSNGNAIYRY